MIKTLTSLALLAGALTMLASPAGAQAAEVGAKPNYSFRETPTNGMGIKNLKELRGKPVLIEFWGTK